MVEIRAYERALCERLVGGLKEIEGVTIYGLTDPARFDWRVPTVACNLAGYAPHEVAARLGEEGIFVWDGNYYALAVMERLGLEEGGGAVRIGPTHYNTVAEIDRTLDVLRRLDPDAAPAGGPAFTLIVNGSNFVSGSTVYWNGTSRATTFVSATQLKAAITEADIAAAGSANVNVVSPTPGGGPSNVRAGVHDHRFER